MRISGAFFIMLLASGIGLSACSSDEAAPEPSATQSPEVVERPESAGREGSLSLVPARSSSFSPVDSGMLGMHVVGAQRGSVALGSGAGGVIAVVGYGDVMVAGRGNARPV